MKRPQEKATRKRDLPDVHNPPDTPPLPPQPTHSGSQAATLKPHSHTSPAPRWEPTGSCGPNLPKGRPLFVVRVDDEQFLGSSPRSDRQGPGRARRSPVPLPRPTTRTVAPPSRPRKSELVGASAQGLRRRGRRRKGEGRRPRRRGATGRRRRRAEVEARPGYIGTPPRRPRPGLAPAVPHPLAPPAPPPPRGQGVEGLPARGPPPV